MVVGCQFSCQWSVVGCQWARRVDESIHFAERVYRDWKNVRRRGLSVASSVVSGQLSVVSRARSVDESIHFGERVYRDWKNVRRRGLSVASSVVSGQLSVVSGLEGSMKVFISVGGFIEIGRTFGGEGCRLPVQLSVVGCQ
jgi:predicted methyltransferase MtxX (methanogen marker protein 4)